MRVAAAYLGALPVTETNCVTKFFQPENCPNCHPTKICGLHSSEGIEAFVAQSFLLFNIIKTHKLSNLNPSLEHIH